MYKVLFFVLLFVILIPIVWKIVNRVFFKVTNELSNDKDNANDVIETFLHQKDKLDKRRNELEEKSRQAKGESDKLDKFLNNNNKSEE